MLSGTVVALPDGRPVGGTRIGVWLEESLGGGLFRGSPRGGVTADAEGRFVVSDLPRGSLAVLFPDVGGVGAPLTQACAAAARIDRDTELEVELVPVGVRGLSRRSSTPALSGIVFETTPEGRRPVPDAWVGYDWRCDDGQPEAAQRTDAEGRYDLCRLPLPAGCVWVYKEGRGVTMHANFQGDAVLDIDFTSASR